MHASHVDPLTSASATMIPSTTSLRVCRCFTSSKPVIGMVDESNIPTADGRQDIAKLASLPGDAVVARTRPESHALVVTFSRDGEEPEEMFASDGQRAWGNAITLIAKRESLLSGDTLTVRRTEEDLTVEIIRRPQGESMASNLTTLNFRTLGGSNEG